LQIAPRVFRKIGCLFRFTPDNGDHSLDQLSNDALDYTIRMTQFFDHYLKGMPAPKWMVEGIPASRKGIDNGLELEPTGVGPGPGLLISKDQQRTADYKN
jgi:hypothetical protein